MLNARLTNNTTQVFGGFTVPDLSFDGITKESSPEDLKDYYNNVVYPLLEERYFVKGETNEDQMFRRIADFVARTDDDKEIFYQMMKQRLFLPATPTLMNAGKEKFMGSSCFVITPEDNMDSITDYWKTMALVQKYGGGVGCDWSLIRPQGSDVQGTGGIASGWKPFFEVANAINKAIKQGSVRSGANASTLSITHPQIMEFIDVKKNDPAKYGFFNLSVTVTDKEFQSLLNDELITTHFGEKLYTEEYTIVNDDGTETEIPTQFRGAEFIDKMARNAWKNGDPSFYFIDRINAFWTELGIHERLDPWGIMYGLKVTHNPCGEQGLASHTACNLASVNLFAMVNPDTNEFQYELFRMVTQAATRFLDSVIDKVWFPDERITKNTKHLRNIGLGFMGLADVFYLKGWEYGDLESCRFSDIISRQLTDIATYESHAMAVELGPAPVLEQEPKIMLRNTDLTCIAPTGSISLLGLCSSGIEPYFFHEYEKLVYPKGTRTTEKYIKIKPPAVMLYKRSKPKTSTELTPKQHIDVLAMVSKNVTNAVSKTVNLPEETTVEQIKELYEYAFKSGVKSFTVFRNNSRSDLAVREIKEEDQFITKEEFKESAMITQKFEPIKPWKPIIPPIAKNGGMVEITNSIILPSNDSHVPNIYQASYDSPYVAMMPPPERYNPCPTCSTGEIVLEAGCKSCNSCGWQACSM